MVLLPPPSPVPPARANSGQDGPAAGLGLTSELPTYLPPYRLGFWVTLGVRPLRSTTPRPVFIVPSPSGSVLFFAAAAEEAS